jgi:hypothetical protein
MRRRLLVALLACNFALSGVTSFAQSSVPLPAQSGPEDLESLMWLLLETIESMSDYRATRELPPIFQVPQHVLEAKVCDAPCNVTAAYVPREGIYLAGNLDPVREPLDRSALLHELVHYLQQGHAKFAPLAGCERERAKEQEAYAIQNAYLARLGLGNKITFYDSEFDCRAERVAPAQ